MRLLEFNYRSYQPNQVLYHGTLRKWLPSIKATGLEPRIGKFTRNAYDLEPDEDGYPDLVFAADKKGLISCYSAILGHIKHEFPGIIPTSDVIMDKGALLILRNQINNFDHYHRDDEGYVETPSQAEPGDYYADRHIEITDVLTGKKMFDFFLRHGIFPSRNDPMVLRKMIGRAVQSFLRKGMSKSDALVRVKTMSFIEVYNLLAHSHDPVLFD